MAQTQVGSESVELHVENVGGIDETTVEFSPGVTVLTGRNATNRTSLLQAIMAALGSDQATIKGDAEEAHIELTVGETTYTRRLRRQNGTITTDGDPYLEDATLADLFAFLLEQNEARQAVARGDDLRDIIMRPVDTDDIEAQIEQREHEREEIDAELDEISSLKQRLPDLEGQRADLEDQIEDKRQELAAKEEDIDAIDADVQAQRQEQEQLEATLEELNDVRKELETVRQEIDTHQDSIDALQNERENLEADREEYSDVPDERLEEIDTEIQRLRQQLSSTETTLDELQTLIEFNEDFLDGGLDIFSELHEASDDGPVTEQLLEDEQGLVCWTCGSDVDTGQVEAMLDRLRDLRSQTMEQYNDLEAQIDELEDERIELQERTRQHEQVHSRLEQIEKEITDHEERLTELREQRSELTEQVEQLEAAVEELRSEDQNDLLDLHAEANRLEIEIERLEDDLQDVEDEITRIEERIAQQDQLETQREELQSEIEDLRTRIERLEEQAVEEFNQHMDAMVDILEFENVERIWIERTEQEVREGRTKTTKGAFDLHIVRSTESGSVYEDTVEHLSESERETTGLVFALAGYLTHDLHEEVPFILLDSLEALDSGRIAALVDYFREYADYLVVALLSEDAEALDESYQRITEI